MKKQKLKVADLEDPTKRLKPEEIEEIVEMNDLEDPKIPSYYYDIQNAQEHFFNKGTLSLISGFLFISLTLILLIARDSDIYFWSLLCSFLGFGFSFNRPKSPFPSYILQSGQIVEMPQKGTLESKKLFEAMKKRRNALVLFFFNLPFFAILTYYGSFNPVKSIQTFNWQDVGTLILTFISSVVWTYGIQYIHFWKTLKNEKKEKLITKHSILGFDSFKTNWWHNLLIIMAAISGILFYVFGIISFKPYLGILLSQKITNGTITKIIQLEHAICSQGKSCERPIVEYFDTQGQKHFLSSLKYTQGTNKVGDIRTVVYDKHNPQISEYKDQFWAIIFMAILISITIVMMTAWAHVYIIAWIINKLMGSKIR